MTTTTRVLNFETDGKQSLWEAGRATNLRIDTGESLLLKTGPLSQTIGGSALSVTPYADLTLGLVAYAELGNTGSFEASYSFKVAVGAPAAVDTRSANQTMAFDFSRWGYVSADISSEGFDPSPKAGLDLIVKIDAGIRASINLDLGFTSIREGFDLGLDIDERFPLITITPNTSFERELFPGITLKGALPTGADTEGSSTGKSTVSANGFSDTRFVELEADLDELLVNLVDKIPYVGAVARVLGETVFAEREFGPAAFRVSYTAVDVNFGVGAVITEDVRLDVAQYNGAPDVRITLRSDNGTPTYYGDDVIGRGQLGGVINLHAPTTKGYGFADVTAYYDLNNVKFNHKVGIGLTASFTIIILKGELSGSLVPDALEFTFGPIKKYEYPEDGWQLKIGNFYGKTFTLANGGFANASAGTSPESWNYKDGAFAQLTDHFQVFYTDRVPNGWNPEATNAVEAVLDFRQALAINLASAVSKTEQLWSGSGRTQVVKDDIFGEMLLGTVRNTTAIWDGGQNAIVEFLQTDPSGNNFVVVAPVASQGQAIKVNIGLQRSTITQLVSPITAFASAVGFDSSIADKTAFLYRLNKASETQYPLYELGTGTSQHKLQTNIGAEIVGTGKGDVLVDFDSGKHFFDGGSQGSGEYDVFFANFLATAPDTRIVWNLADRESNAKGVDLGNGVTVVNIESMWLIAGNGNDDIQTYQFSDWVDASGGEDFIVNNGDRFDDYISAGAGNDLILNNVISQPTPQAAVNQDRIAGGAGNDVAIHDGTGTAQSLRLDLVKAGAPVFGGNGLGADAGFRDLSRLLVTHATQVYGISPAELESGGYGVVFINNSLQQGSTRYSTDIEQISVLGSDLANDLVLFMGGGVNRGGDGSASQADTLAANFYTYEKLLDIPGGLNIDLATPDPISFGDSRITGFERLALIGTTHDDVVSGGALADLISGEKGNDWLFGGVDSRRDVLAGGAGDDWFLWSDDGSDVIRGDDSFYFANTNNDIDTLYIKADGVSELHGLYYDFHTKTSFDDALAGVSGADIVSKPSFNATDSSADLLLAVKLVGEADSNGTYVRAVSFIGTTVNGAFMTYSGIERTNITASDAYSDLLIYEDGATYDGGEAPGGGDTDTFAGDFRTQPVGIDFNIAAASTADGLLLNNGVYLRGIERAVVLAGEGDDVLRGGAANDYFNGGGGTDRLWGGAGNDELLGGPGNDLAYWMSDGIDSADGGEGSDVLVIAAGTAGLGIALSSGSGAFDPTGTVTTFSGNTDMLKVVTPTGSPGEQIRSRISSNAQSVAYQNFESVNVFGQDAYDDFILYQGGVSYNGGERAGDADVFAGNFSSLTQDLTVGADPATGSSYKDIGNGTFVGEFERLFVRLGSGNDHASGGELDDYIDGGPGNDDIDGGPGGRDHLIGGSGDDILSLRLGQFSTLDGGPGHDTANIQSDDSGLLLVEVDDSKGAALNGAPLTAGNTASRSALTLLFDNVLAAEAKLYFTTQNAGYSLTGIENINVAGGAGNDLLISGAAGGNLAGGAGVDLLVSRRGADVLLGGAGRDVYAFDTDMGDDLIAGESLDGGELFFIHHAVADLKFGAVGDDLKITAKGGSVTVANYFAAGGNGLDFTFDTSDFHGKKDLQSLGGAVRSVTRGQVQVGTDNDDRYDLAAFSSSGSDAYTGLAGNDYFVGSPGADVYDGGIGLDVMSYAQSATGVTVDLQAARGYGGDAAGDVLINIEILAGGPGPNTLSGDLLANTLVGGDSPDTLSGRGGTDFLIGGGGGDQLNGGEGDDFVFGDDGNDTLNGDDGNDLLEGNAGNDLLTGGAGADTLSGNAGDDSLYGGDGNDFLIYGGDDDPLTLATYEDGADLLDGGAGLDTVAFSAFRSAVLVSLSDVNVVARTSDKEIIGANALRDIATLLNIENVIGSTFSDVLKGNALANQLAGGPGDDLLAGARGADSIDGGTGSDTIDYSAENGPRQSIVVELGPVSGTVVDTWGDIDSVSGVENIVGTAFDDVMNLDDVGNIVFAGGGNDLIQSNGGDDWIDGGAGEDQIDGGSGNDVIAGGPDKDRLIGNLGDDVLSGEGGNDFVDGGAGDDTLAGGPGDNLLNGGDGIDTVSYVLATAPVVVNLQLASATGAGFSDELRKIEVVYGSNFNDTLTGNDSSAESDGNDWLFGGAGNDALDGGSGDDWLDGGAGNDTIAGGRGTDTVSYAGAASAVVVDLLRGTATGGGGSDRLVLFTVENVYASSLADTLVGDSNSNVLDGAEGSDTVIYAGVRSSYEITPRGIGFTVNSATDGFDTLLNIEFVQFSDQKITLSTLADNLAPLVMSVTPSDGAREVGVSDNIVLNFDEPVQLGSGNVILKNASGETFAIYDAASSPNLRISGNSLIIDPDTNLAPGTTYVLELEAGTTRDLSRNAFAGTLAYDFATSSGLTDTTAPTVSAFSPANGGANVAVGSNIVVTFSEPVQRGSGTILLKTAEGTTVETFNASSSARLSTSGATLTIDPSADLNAGAKYFVDFVSGSIRDTSGNAYAGVTSGYSFSTQTGAPATDITAPTVSAFSPANGGANVAVGSNIVVTFSEPVQRGSGTILLKTAEGTTVETFNASSSARLSTSGTTLTIDPSADLNAGVQYFVDFASGSIIDPTGNAYAGIVSGYSFVTRSGSVLNLSATPGNDTLTGGAGDDALNSLAGDDSNEGGPGADAIAGGLGLDTAKFSGPSVSYTIQVDSTGTGGTVQDLRSGSPDGTDSLASIEYLQFSDRRISLPEFALGTPVTPDAVGTQVYRFAKLDNGQYFYTGNAAERDQINASFPNFRFEGAVYNAQDNWVTDYSPVYRFANLSNGGYFYTASAAERDSVFSSYPNFRYEGATFFVPAAPSADTIPVFRLANLLTGGYLFTTSQAERSFAVSLGNWRDEGVAFNSPRAIALNSQAMDDENGRSQSFQMIDEDSVGDAAMVFADHLAMPESVSDSVHVEAGWLV